MKSLINHLTLFTLLLTSSMVFAQQVKKEDLKLLPPYCKGTQLIRNVSGDTTPIDEYIKLYGPAFSHLHHYCWALNTENKYYRRELKKGSLQHAIGDLDYVLRNSPPDFIFIPEVHLAKARFYSILDQPGMAMASAQRAIQVKSDYAQAYVFISDLYENMGDKANAVKTLKSGFYQAPNSKPILRRMTRLGITPPKFDKAVSPNNGGPVDPASVSVEANTQKSPITTTLEPSGPPKQVQDLPMISTPLQPTLQTEPDATQKPQNPYCRFCP